MKIKNTSKKAPKIVNTSEKAKRIDPEEIARRLGAKIVASNVKSRPGFWGAITTYLKLKGKKDDHKVRQEDEEADKEDI